nr:cytochrome P450 [Kibdelosporangium sp. MJ126-NF4]CEL18411.1 cytochrome P450 [Kibdelosporangium sp. MJ126-NF4]CTQ97894.1 cytochrome P450 [Kibdelosporangium sp. MJ126-NF4]
MSPVHTTSDRLPPAPAESPQEQRVNFHADPFGYVEKQAAEHGTVFAIDLGSLGNEDAVDIKVNGQWVFVSRPHQIRAMYSAVRTTSGAEANQVFFGTMEESVGYIDGKAHRRRRAQLHPAFSGGKDYIAIIQQAVDRHFAQWPRDKAFPVYEELQKLTSEVIVEVVCGNFSAEDRAELCELLPRTENARYTLDEVIAADKEIRAFVAERIPGHVAKSDRIGQDDVFASLLRHAAEGDESLTDEVVRDEVFSLLYTGFSTTANTLSWVFAEITRRPEVLARLRAEVGDRFRDRPLSRDEFGDLDYLDATISETLRLHPVSALNGVRLLKEPLRIDDYLVPAGSILVHCAYLSQRSAEVYDRPEEFLPERFVGTTIDPYVFGAFGGGQRTCVGRGYARAEMKMILAMAVAGLDWAKNDTPLPTAKQQGIFMGPEDHAVITLLP